MSDVNPHLTQCEIVNPQLTRCEPPPYIKAGSAPGCSLICRLDLTKWIESVEAIPFSSDYFTRKDNEFI